ncbi:MAG: leucine-rich repeat protein [Muribaculaceae bacterium]|nr:leucine-rich repeat protein [Muribaculaceae bacterium]
MKNKQLKRWLAAALCLAVTLTASAFWVDGICYSQNPDGKSVTVTYDHLDYDVDANQYIGPTYDGLNGALIIPSVINVDGELYDVVAIGDHAFYQCGITSVYIPNTVTTISSSAFELCCSLESVNIPNSVTEIGSFAFWSCSKLASVAIPDSVTKINQETFEGCSNLTSVSIGKSVTNIGFSAFKECNNLTSVYITDLAAWLDIDYGQWGHPFESSEKGDLYLNGSKITSLVIPDGIEKLKEGGLYGCSGLTSVTIPNSMKIIGSSAFYGCTGLTSITIPNSVIQIAGGAFKKCTGLTSITIPNKVTTINGLTFSGCTSLEKVCLGPEVRSILFGAFEKCSSIKDIICLRDRPAQVEENVNWFTFSPNVFYTATVHVPKGSLSSYYSAPVWMRFDNYIDDADAFVVKGDLTGDGCVDINDVNAMVNLILGRSSLYHDQADVTADGKVNVADLNAVVNIMLGRIVE